MNKKNKNTISTTNFVTCDFCGQQEKGKGYLQRHIDRKHRKFFCNVCGQVYSLKKTLMDHLRSHFERFTCQYCGLEIVRFEQFQKHVYQKHEPKNKDLILSIQTQETYDCRHCVRTFPNAVHRNRHESIVHKGRTEEAFKCSDCSSVFLTKDELRSHSFDHYTGALYFCSIPDCDRFFKTKKQLANHNYIHGPATFECNKCLKRFGQPTNLSKHKRRCKGETNGNGMNKSKKEQEDDMKAAEDQFQLLGGKRPVKPKTAASANRPSKCKIIQIDPMEEEPPIEFVEYLEEYSNEVKPDNFSTGSVNVNATRARSSKIFVCEVCAIQTNSERSLQAHLAIHRHEKSFDDMKKIRLAQKKARLKRSERICDLCGHTSTSKQQLREHFVQHHADSQDLEKPLSVEKSFVCNVCAMSFKYSSILKNHLKSHEDPTECPICHKLLPNMARHLKWHQRPKPAPFKCSQCGKLCSTKQVLQEHTRRVHEKVPLGKTYTCDVCELNFIRNKDLRRHSFIHFSGKIYSCNTPGCNEMFKKATNLQEHAKVHDSCMEANFDCNYCEKKYLRKSALSKHQRQAHKDLVKKLIVNTS